MILSRAIRQSYLNTYFGLVAAGFLISVAAVFAFAAAVGAVAVDCRKDVWLVFGFGAAALTGSLGAGFAVVLAAATGFETGVAAFGADTAAEGLVLVGVFGAAFGSGLFTGVLFDAEALVVEIAAGFLGSSLPFVASVPFALVALEADFGVWTAGSAGAAGAVGDVFEGSLSESFKSSASGERALPPETAEASVGSAGFRETSSCAPVVGLSGFSAGVSCAGARVASCSFTGSSLTAASSGAGASSGCVAPASVSADGSGNSEPFIMWPRFMIFPSGSFLMGGGPAEESREATACSGTGSMIATLFLRSSLSSLMDCRSSATSPAVSSLTLKLSRRFAAVLFEGVPLLTPAKSLA